MRFDANAFIHAWYKRAQRFIFFKEVWGWK